MMVCVCEGSEQRIYKKNEHGLRQSFELFHNTSFYVANHVVHVELVQVPPAI